jgi:hypothetical protein
MEEKSHAGISWEERTTVGTVERNYNDLFGLMTRFPPRYDLAGKKLFGNAVLFLKRTLPL